MADGVALLLFGEPRNELVESYTPIAHMCGFSGSGFVLGKALGL